MRICQKRSRGCADHIACWTSHAYRTTDTLRTQRINASMTGSERVSLRKRMMTTASDPTLRTQTLAATGAARATPNAAKGITAMRSDGVEQHQTRTAK